ncbi:methyltransferase [Prevotella sp. S7-1-8]|nr:methyltransferase [Prevotella sp. S7-1-8]
MEHTFKFKNFSLRQDRCAMKVGTDGVLLGAWARGGSRVLDIGTGTGVIAMMLAQRFPNASIDGIDIDMAAARQARDNVEFSKFARQIKIYHSSFQDYVPTASYDAIVSNPPFFIDSLKNNDIKRMLARHAEVAFFKSLFRFSKQWLSICGEISLVVPKICCEQIETEAYLLGFMLSRKIYVSFTSDKKAERVLLSFVQKRSLGVEDKEVYLFEKDGRRSFWFNEMTQDFYLQ